jgi:hypothetical protein
VEVDDIFVNDLIRLDALEDYKLHFAVWNGDDQPLDVFVESWDDWVGWNTYRGTRDDFNRKYIFSLIRFYLQPEKWLFGGIFEVAERPADSYVLKLDEPSKKWIGRLLVDYPGPGVQGRAFYLEKHFSRLKVSQVLEKRYVGEAFCGYENIDHSFSLLEPIFRWSRHDWKAALENVKGVYLIVDKSNGKAYVGSAYGEAGIWSRWACYIGTGHGWNDELTKLINTHGIGYARENFKFSILEYRSMKTDDEVIKSREQFWKGVLLSGKFGYNKN